MLTLHLVFCRKHSTEPSSVSRSWRKIPSQDLLSYGWSATRQIWTPIDKSQRRYNTEAHLNPIHDRFVFIPSVFTASWRRDAVWPLTEDYISLRRQHCRGIMSTSCWRMLVGVQPEESSEFLNVLIFIINNWVKFNRSDWHFKWISADCW